MIKQKQICTLYGGTMEPENVEGIIEILKGRLEVDALTLQVTQSIFSIFVEQIHTVLYCTNKNEKAYGTFILGSEGKTYFLQTGIIVNTEYAHLLKSIIDSLNGMDKNALRIYYKEQLKMGWTKIENIQLGLIEVARRASSKIEYELIPYAHGQIFFAMYTALVVDN